MYENITSKKIEPYRVLIYTVHAIIFCLEHSMFPNVQTIIYHLLTVM